MVRRTFALILLIAVCASAGAAERVLTVFAAASLTNVLEEIGQAYSAESGVPVRFSFAASSALARQIESGAPADVFVSADQEWMDYLQSRNLIQLRTRTAIVSNTLVLVAPTDSNVKLDIARGFPLAAALGERGRLAVADPETVPAGRYAKVALTSLGVWESVATRLVPSDNVRTALNFVARGEAPLGIVYGTDARSDIKVRVVGVFPADSHVPIRYPAAATANAGPDATAFVIWLCLPKAQAIFARYGFGPPVVSAR